MKAYLELMIREEQGTPFFKCKVLYLKNRFSNNQVYRVTVFSRGAIYFTEVYAS